MDEFVRVVKPVLDIGVVIEGIWNGDDQYKYYDVFQSLPRNLRPEIWCLKYKQNLTIYIPHLPPRRNP